MHVFHGTSSSVSINYALWKLKSGGTPCTPGAGNVTQTDCITGMTAVVAHFDVYNVVGPSCIMAVLLMIQYGTIWDQGNN